MNKISDIQNKIDDCISEMTPVSLADMKSITLMNRTDTKYVLSVSLLAEMLQLVRGDYNVQEISGLRRVGYDTVYFDTPDMQMYASHLEGRKVREKIRVRSYLATNQTYIEVKNKTSDGRTMKRRLEVAGADALQTKKVGRFMKANAWFSLDEIEPALRTTFRRITLVNKAMTERLTIDTDVVFSNLRNGVNTQLPHVAIVEIKRDGGAESPMNSVLRKEKVDEAGFSKYCVGCALTDESLRMGRIEKKLRKLAKINVLTDLYKSVR
ncbi:MAG: polyphosphate polymerase domain-containing protein [Bacteroidales bacterium]|nr:polyphosphate polymerase domain-containing protein [Bacteroidales bacterium]